MGNSNTESEGSEKATGVSPDMRAPGNYSSTNDNVIQVHNQNERLKDLEITEI